jgi:hypothetical protein
VGEWHCRRFKGQADVNFTVYRKYENTLRELSEAQYFGLEGAELEVEGIAVPQQRSRMKKRMKAQARC